MESDLREFKGKCFVCDLSIELEDTYTDAMTLMKGHKDCLTGLPRSYVGVFKHCKSIADAKQQTIQELIKGFDECIMDLMAVIQDKDHDKFNRGTQRLFIPQIIKYKKLLKDIKSKDL